MFIITLTITITIVQRSTTALMQRHFSSSHATHGPVTQTTNQTKSTNNYHVHFRNIHTKNY